MKLGQYDFAVVRGNNSPVAFRFSTSGESGQTPLDLSGSELVLTIVSRQCRLRRSSADGGLLVDGPAGLVTWQPTPEDTRAIPEGRLSRYELEWRQSGGLQLTLLTGAITGVGGINDD